jgi:hypothetical protein
VASNLADNLRRVSDLHDRIRGQYYPNAWFLYGTGLLTDVAVFYEGSSLSPVRLEAGDGTVPSFSAAKGVAGVPLADLAKNPSAHLVGYLGGLDHGRACCHDEVVQAVLAILRHLP